MRERIRPFVEEMVREQAAASGSRMRAYDEVARKLKQTSSWVRKLTGGAKGILTADGYFDFLAAYNAHSAWMEGRAAAAHARAAKLLEEAHAIRAGTVRPGLGNRERDLGQGLSGLDESAL